MTPQTAQTATLNRSEVLKDNTARREFGKQHMSAVVIYLLSQNQWSHPILEELAEFALNEVGALHTSQISHIRNGRMRMLGVKTVDALGAINVATWAYHNDRELLKQMGTAQLTARIEELLKDAKAIIDPNTDSPVDAGGWINLYLGYIQIPGVVGGAGSADFQSASVAIGGFIEKVIKESGKDFMQAKAIFASASDETKARKMIAAAASIDSYSTDELTADIATICKALKALDGKDREPSAIVAALT